MNRYSLHKEEKGVVLITVIIVIAILTTLVVDFVYSTHIDYEISTNTVRDIRSKYIARSGINVVKAVMVNNDLEELSGQIALAANISTGSSDGNWTLSVSSFPVGDGFVSITVQDERSKINMNSLVNQSSNQVDFQVLTQLTELFRYLGVESGKADIFISSLINWLDSEVENSKNDQDPRGATASYYSSLGTPYRIKDGPLDSLDEIKLIQGMDQEFFNMVSRYLTIYPDNKLINFSTASKPVIIAGLLAAQVSANEDQGENDANNLKDEVAEEIADQIIAERSSNTLIRRTDVRNIVRDVDSTISISAGLTGIVLNNGRSETFSVKATGFTGQGDSTSRTVEAVLVKERENRSFTTKTVSWKER